MVSCAPDHAKATVSTRIDRVRRGSVVTDTTKSVVLDRELEEEKPSGSEPPRIRCPLCGWHLRQTDSSGAKLSRLLAMAPSGRSCSYRPFWLARQSARFGALPCCVGELPQSVGSGNK